MWSAATVKLDLQVKVSYSFVIVQHEGRFEALFIHLMSKAKKSKKGAEASGIVSHGAPGKADANKRN